MTIRITIPNLVGLSQTIWTHLWRSAGKTGLLVQGH